MKTIDFVFLIPLLYGAYKGYRRGFTMTIFQFVAILLGLTLGFKLLHWGMEWLLPYTGKTDWLPALSFVLIFVGVVLLVNMAGKALKKFLDIILLGTIDNLLGAILNLLKWSFFIGSLALLIQKLNITTFNEAVNESIVAMYVIKFAAGLLDIVTAVAPVFQELVTSLSEATL